MYRLVLCLYYLKKKKKTTTLCRSNAAVESSTVCKQFRKEQNLLPGFSLGSLPHQSPPPIFSGPPISSQQEPPCPAHETASKIVLYTSCPDSSSLLHLFLQIALLGISLNLTFENF